MMKQTQKQARPLGQRGIQRQAFHLPCVTNGTALRVESRLERLVALALDIDPRVVGISAQPMTIRLDTGEVYPTQKAARASFFAGTQGQRFYTPDFLVQFANLGNLLIECKPSKMAAHMVQQLSECQLSLAAVGLSLRVITDEAVDFPGLEGNLVRIRDAIKGVKQYGWTVDADRFEQFFSGGNETTTLGALLMKFSEVDILVAIATGVLAADLRAGSLGRATAAKFGHGDLTHLQLLDLED